RVLGTVVALGGGTAVVVIPEEEPWHGETGHQQRRNRQHPHRTQRDPQRFVALALRRLGRHATGRWRELALLAVRVGGPGIRLSPLLAVGIRLLSPLLGVRVGLLTPLLGVWIRLLAPLLPVRIGLLPVL